jgi:hypothetical protein
MSAATTTPERSGVGTNSKLLRKLAAGTSVAAVLAVTTIAVWPASETEKARDDGQRVGAAVAQLQSAGTTDEVDDALAELHDAAASTADHAGDAVANQVDDQVYALDRAVDGFVGTHTADDSFSADVYQSELKHRRRRPDQPGRRLPHHRPRGPAGVLGRLPGRTQQLATTNERPRRRACHPTRIPTNAAGRR